MFRRVVAAAFIMSLVPTHPAATQPPGTGVQAKRLPTSPPGEVLVLSVNVQEAFTPSDVQNSVELRTFAARLREQVRAGTLPYVPDVLLLQEVVTISTTRMARFLKQTTGYTYAILLNPEVSPIIKDTAEYQIVRDTAILINAATMRAIGTKGFITTRYGVAQSRNAEKPRWKQHAYAAAEEKSGGFGLALASVHYTPTEEMASESIAFDRKGRWANQLAEHLAKVFPKQHTRVIGGHVNNRRCVTKTQDPPERIDCDPPGPGGETPFWTTLTQPVAPFRYEDAIFAIHGGSDATLKQQYRTGDGLAKKRIDFVFARARVLSASHDTTYGAHRGDAGYISDHRLVWSLVGRRGT